MSPQDEQAYGLHLPPKERVNFLLRDHTQKQLLKRPIADYIYDIIKWLELAEKKAKRDALEAAMKICKNHIDCNQAGADCSRQIIHEIRFLMPEEKS